MMGINRSLYEATDIDGATSWQKFIRITLPLLKPVLLYTLVTSAIGGLQLYDIPALFNTNGSTIGYPDDTSTTVTMYIMRLHSTDTGRAAAVSILLFLVTVPATALSVYFSALTAYGIHAYDFKLKKAARGFILAVMMVPTQVFAIGYYKFMIQLKLIDTYWPLIIPAITTPVVVFFLRQYLLGALPLEVVEAARIDGSGEFHTFNTIVLPIMKPALAVQAIFQFVANWNSLFLPSLIINSTGKKTLTMFVQMLMGESFRADYGVIFLALSITILPMFIMYFLLSRYIVEGVSLGSVKG